MTSRPELEATDGRGWAAEVHCGPLQFVAALSTHLQILRRRLGDAEADRIGHMMELSGAAVRELRQLTARLEPPGDAESLAAGLEGSGHRVLGSDVEVADRTDGTLPAPVQREVLGLGHRALVEMRRMGGGAPCRIEVERSGGGVAVRIAAAAGDRLIAAEGTLRAWARLAGGSAELVAGPAELVATVWLPCLDAPVTDPG